MITVRVIVQYVAMHFDVSELDIYSARRSAQLVKARHITMWLANELTSLSMPSIGRLLGGKDHTTVLHAISQVKKNLHNDPAWKNEIQEIILGLQVATNTLENLGQEFKEFDALALAERVLRMPIGRRSVSANDLELLCATLVGAITGELEASTHHEVAEAEAEFAASIALKKAITQALLRHQEFQSARFSNGEMTSIRLLERAMTNLSSQFKKETGNDQLCISAD